MAMITTENSVIINRPIEEVFDTATCMESCVNWWTMLTEAKKVSAGPTGVGSEYHHTAKFMGVEMEARPVITVWEPAQRFAYKSDTATAEMEVAYTFEPVDGGTYFRSVMNADTKDNVISAEMLPVIAHAMARQLEDDMNVLKEMMNNGVQVKIT